MRIADFLILAALTFAGSFTVAFAVTFVFLFLPAVLLRRRE